ncbi:MAG: hypothetical protein JSS02_26600 [Planctomycetes bacterium]|nr:hypothetical protein [Planctomycetota bacterium]
MRIGARCLVGLILATALVRTGSAQEAGPKLSDAAPAGAPASQEKFLGGSRCLDCHSQAEPRSRDFCQMNEALIFRKHDKHYGAFEALKNPLSAKMEEALAEGKAKIDAWQDERCLGCHLGAPAEYAKVYTESGLTCEACHGPSQKWDLPHTDASWRLLPPGEKEGLGMLDIRQPVKRAKVCYSCHIGNSAENKVVTHAMYAAGHPPLTSLEIEAFTEAMPRHWRNLREKGDFQHRAQYVAVNPGIDDDLRHTKSVLVSGLIAMSESVRLVATESQKPEHPEWATFDCQACHHELRLPAWRQARRPAGRPGRPRPAEWPSALLFATGDGGNWGTQVKDRLKSLNEALDVRPFGEPALLLSAVQGAGAGNSGLVTLLEERATAIASGPLKRADLVPVLEGLYSLKQDFLRDFHSARQVAWAIRAIETELRLGAARPEFAKRAESETVAERAAREKSDQDSLEKWRRGTSEAVAAEVRKTLGGLDSYLFLGLAPDDHKFAENSLKTMQKYDPREFQKLLREAYQHSAIHGGERAAGLSDLEPPLR